LAAILDAMLLLAVVTHVRRITVHNLALIVAFDIAASL